MISFILVAALLVGQSGAYPSPRMPMPMPMPSGQVRGGPPGQRSVDAVASRYRLGGDRYLRPSGIEDDGVKTYLQWPANVPLPAVYVADLSGRESLANGMMRGDRLVVDAIAPRFVFRLDDRVATAARLPPKARRR